MLLKPIPPRCLPPVLPAIIERRRLLERLRAHRNRRVVVVAAQPAQGKTTLVAAFLAAAGVTAAWCRIDRAAADATGFLRRLACAVEAALQAVPGGADRRLDLPETGLCKNSDRCEDLLGALIAALPRPAAIVLDGLDDLRGADGATAVIEKLILAIPDGVQLFLVSRQTVSFKLQRFRVGGQLLTLNTADLAFDDEEIREFFTVHHRLGLVESQLRRIGADTEGWTGGLVLLAEALSRMTAEQRTALQGDEMARLIGTEANSYFFEEIFLTQTPAAQTFLLKTALFYEFDAQMAAEITAMADALAILTDLVARNLFLQVRYDSPRRDVYRYNPLFREFLRAHGRVVFRPLQRIRLLRRIGRFYSKQNRSDLAADYYLLAGDFKLAARAIRRAALDMTIGDRLAQLGRWVDALPATLRAADPWIVLWQAVSRRSPGGVKPIDDLHKALAGFKANDDLRGQCFALAYLMETAVFQGTAAEDLFLWLTRSEALLRRIGPRPYYTYAKALLWRQIGFGHIFGSGDLPSGLSACRNAELLARRISDDGLQRTASVITSFVLAELGEVAGAAQCLEQAEVPARTALAPEFRVLHKLGQSRLALFTGDLRRASSLLEAVRGEIDASGLLFLYPVLLEAQGMLQVYQGAYSEADVTARHCEDVAVMMSSNARIEAAALRLRAMIHCHQGDYSSAVRLAGEANEKLAERACHGVDSLYTCLLYGIACWHLDRRSEALRALETAREGFYRMGSAIGKAESHLALALLAESEKRLEAAGVHLAEGLALVDEKGCRHFIVMGPAEAVRVCRLALTMNPGPRADSARRLLASVAPANGKAPGEDTDNSAVSFAARRARLPRLEISTLGGFAVRRDGGQAMAEQEWHGHQPRLLLKAIIARGVAEVPKETLIDDLWPEIEATAAMQRFKVTLHRLRSALEARIDRRFRWAYVRLKDHLVSLDPELCQIDTVAFQECCAQLRVLDPGADGEQTLALCRRARAIYQGDFLPEEPYLPCIEAKRNALRDDYVQVLCRMADILEDRSRSEEAIEILAAIVQAAPSREDILRRLMQRYDARGQRPLALQAYEKFRDLLSTDLGVPPDPATTNLYRRLLDWNPAPKP